MTLSDRSTRAAPGAGRAASPIPLIAFVYLGIIVLTWAGNWPLMKLALGQVSPLKFVLLRLVGGLVLIAPALLAARQKLMPYRGERLSLFWVGELQVAGFMICSIIGLSILPAGRAAFMDAGALRTSRPVGKARRSRTLPGPAIIPLVCAETSPLPPAVSESVLSLYGAP
jgi:hypothetical protein